MAYEGQPSPQGLYDPQHDHDSCGVGFVVHLKGQKSHRIIEQGLQILINLSHRGACGCEVNTGDGCGILMQMPDRFLRRETAALGFTLPPVGEYGAGLTFLPHDPAARAQIEQLSKKLESELVGLQTKLKEAQTRQQTQASMLSEVAAAQLAKDIDRLNREFTFKQQEAQSELQTMQQDLLADFEKKVLPILEALAKEKNLHAVFNVADSGAVYVFPGLNLSPELVKRVDAQYSAKK